ncbi:MAG: bifunctional oligoribonuclease/PAP phosphatase NrnA [Polyangiaceae bacterium]|nr:bifunctional oligoribonuclease/PAP phosphatase NrnA [Polyangiaceae bacterium]
MDKHEELAEVLSTAKDKPLVVLLGGHPDPDAIGSAMAHQRICAHLGISATIAHVLPVARSENRALVKLLSVPLQKVSEPKDLEEFGYVSLVDASTSEATLALPEHLELLSIVDHHRPSGAPKARFVDVRPDVGSTCTMYAQYMEQGLAPLKGENRDDSATATAMFFGIQTDTDDFALATPSDFRAAAYVKSHCDAEILSRVGRRTMTAEAMKVVKRALLDLEVVRDFALAGVGRVSAVNRDAIPTAADFILRREDIDTVVVYGIVEGRIDGSMRTNSPSVDPATFMQNAFGHDNQGRPYGGGRADMGGFQVPLGVLAETHNDDALWAIVKEIVEARVARVIPDLSPKRKENPGNSG